MRFRRLKTDERSPFNVTDIKFNNVKEYMVQLTLYSDSNITSMMSGK